MKYYPRKILKKYLTQPFSLSNWNEQRFYVCLIDGNVFHSFTLTQFDVELFDFRDANGIQLWCQTDNTEMYAAFCWINNLFFSMVFIQSDRLLFPTSQIGNPFYKDIQILNFSKERLQVCELPHLGSVAFHVPSLRHLMASDSLLKVVAQPSSHRNWMISPSSKYCRAPQLKKCRNCSELSWKLTP